MLSNSRISNGKAKTLPPTAIQLDASHPTGSDLTFKCSRKPKTIVVPKNKDVIVAGGHHDSFYVNLDGWLSRYRILHNGSRQIIDFVLPGEIFGLQACLFRDSLYSVMTITQTSLSAIPRGMIDNAFEQNPQFSKALFWSAVCEAAILGEHLIDAARRSAYERVSHFLLELMVRLERINRTQAMSFDMPLTQELIGDALGLTVVHVNRTLRSLRDDKLIAMDGKRVRILDFEAMCLLSDFENSYLGENARVLRSETSAATTAGRSLGVSAGEPAPTSARDSTLSNTVGQSRRNRR
jgi:CRP-like cAMP-binding protein